MLDGIRVVDFTRAVAGPSCTRLLANLGAEVIKIEPPGGDFTRGYPHLKEGISGFFLQRNYGKKGICVDLRQDAGKEIARKLVAISDVVVENYKPGVMERLGLAYENLAQINEDIILCSISGYGQYGPYREWAAGDHAIQAMTGLMWMAGEEDGPPMWGGNAYTDMEGGIQAFAAICAALLQRDRTGEGEWIDVSLFDCAFWQHESAVEQLLLSDGEVKPKRMGSRRDGTAPSGIYRCRDGYLALVVTTEGGWEALTEALGQPELMQDPRFIDRQARWAHVDELDQLIERWLMQRSSVDEAVALLADRYRLPCAKVLNIGQVVATPQVRERGLLAEVTDPVLGKVMVQTHPVKMLRGKTASPAPAPLLGEHTRTVLCDLLGYPQERVLELLGEGVLQVDDRVLSAVVGEER